ncbi:MAG TPA: radical SAM family heme chaperone HemW [Pirellulales bacterium]|nr:radical SAM family heme chaperone HemW [Pirellulales bacterium]
MPSVALPNSAYIHVPFCRHRCGYCNFTLVAGRDDLIEPFLAALEKELSWLGQPREVETLFLGGGTPTQLKGRLLQRLLQTVLRWHPPASSGPGGVCEFSVEANPADVNMEMASILADHGVTRVSLGSQSFHADKLRMLERDHRSKDTCHAVEIVRSLGMKVSLDLIFGVPGESLADWQSDLAAALLLAPNHISTYGLTFERGTSFWSRLEHGQLAKVEEETERKMYAMAIDCLTEASFQHYEVSNFAQSGNRCRHNEVYWTGGEYFAAGPGAARHVNGVRETNHQSVTKWLHCMEHNQSPVAERECLPPEGKARELLVFGLRRLEGVRRDRFTAKTGYEIDTLVGKPLRGFITAGLLHDDGMRIQLTREGLFVSDSLWPQFLLE